MYKELVINAVGPEIRVALLENGILVEIYIERRDESNITGNIYKGRIQRVLPGMQAAFVDIGANRAAFIYVDDIINGRTNQQEQFYLTGEPDDSDDSDSPVKTVNGQVAHEPAGAADKAPIEALIKEDQEILVQVARSPIGSKGARLTTYISLPGRFLVLMPTVDHIGISRRIGDETERARLKEIVETHRPAPYGYIVRTAGDGVNSQALIQEMEFLNNLWNDICAQHQTAPAPSLLHQELTVTLRSVRDLLAHEADKVTIDSPAVYKSVAAFIAKFMPRLKDSVSLYTGEEAIFDAYNLEVDIQRALKKKVWLKCGGYIIIEITEALVAIDVNTGRYVGKRNFGETVLRTNLEAVKEIAYQIRLRNLGGIIIIDFIDMESKSDQEKVYNALREALKKDKAKTNVLPMSDLGLIQMTRKRVVRSLPRMLYEPCFYCEGEGMLLSRQSICYNIFREIVRQSRDAVGSRVHLKVNPVIADLLLDEESGLISTLEAQIGRQIGIYPVAEYHIEQYEITEVIDG
ncbi:MAG: Rne/Rng family ribonuclease [Thermodesulfobacteriota bacterium]